MPAAAAGPLVADLDRLRADWGEYDLRVRGERIPADEYDPSADPEDGLYRYASAWVREAGRVLLVDPTEGEGWVPPGGTHESGESYEATARRETREEAGVEVDLVGVVEARLTVHTVAGRDVPAVPSLGVIFDARHAGGDPRPEPGEIDAVRWFSEVPPVEDLAFGETAEYPL